MRRCAMWGIVTFEGDLTINQVPEFMKDLKIAMKVWDEIVLDVQNLNHIDISALQMLLAAVKECESNGRKLSVQKSPTLENITAQLGINL
jgi:anti-anti-sigma factor